MNNKSKKRVRATNDTKSKLLRLEAKNSMTNSFVKKSVENVSINFGGQKRLKLNEILRKYFFILYFLQIVLF